MKIALVGYTGSDDDAFCLMDAMEVLKLEGPIALDRIGLAKGRDFLTERKEYDVVILALIFRYSWNELSDIERAYAMLDREMFLSSPLHSIENWRTRLLESKAKYIVCFEYQVEIGHEYLGDLPGYQVTRFDETLMTVYRRV